MKKLLSLLEGLFGLDAARNHPAESTTSIRLKMTTGAVFIVGIGVVVVAIVFMMIPKNEGQSIPIDLTVTSTPAPQNVIGSNGVVLVHVVGNVAHPGIYELHAGSRVIDAVMAAGGLQDGVDGCGMNLARKIMDGEQIYLAPAGQDCLQQTVTSSGEIRVNSASAQELEGLPGIGPAIAQRIISLRDERGGFQRLDELRDVSGVGEKLFAGLQGLITL